MTKPDSVQAVPGEPPEPHKPKRLRWLAGVLGPVVVIAALVYVLLTHGHEIGHAISQVSAGTLVIITALSLLTLLARSEVVLQCMSAMPRRPGRADTFASSSLAFLLSTINHYVGAIVRAAALKRLDPVNAPTIPQMMVIDGSTTLIEGLLAGLLLIVSAGTLNLSWWEPVLALLALITAVAVAVYLRRRFAHLAIFDGLKILEHSRHRLVVLALTVLVFACQIGRTLIVLDAVGLHANLLQAVATFITGGVLSNLLAGPGGGTAAAPIVIFGHDSVATATAAGLILAGVALLAAIIYACAGGGIALWRTRHRHAGGRGPGRSNAAPDPPVS
jgi:uncharacterized membrane protein YbhN (UPF0104 family)